MTKIYFFYIIIKSINDAFLLTNKMAYWLIRRCAKFSTCLWLERKLTWQVLCDEHIFSYWCLHGLLGVVDKKRSPSCKVWVCLTGKLCMLGVKLSVSRTTRERKKKKNGERKGGWLLSKATRRAQWLLKYWCEYRCWRPSLAALYTASRLNKKKLILKLNKH